MLSPFIVCRRRLASLALLRRVTFSPMRKSPKNRLGLSPLRTSLGYQAGTASSCFSARHSCYSPVTATNPGRSGQLALRLGGAYVRAYSGRAVS